MHKRPFILGIIPARGRSKGIPHKNIRNIAGKPLIAWTIEAAQNAKSLDRFVVSTEDSQIVQVAQNWNAEVLHRPKNLATDTADTWDVLKHVLKHINADIVVLLQPTSPIRDKNLIDLCVANFLQARADNLATGFICKFMAYGTYNRRRQDLKGFFYDDGNVYVLQADLIRAGKRMGSKVLRYENSREQSIEIDDPFDFWLAEQVLKKRGRRT